MQPDHIYHVTADHKDEGYRAREKPVPVKELDGKFIAKAEPYGSSKACDTPEEAIHALLRDSGCTDIRIVWSPVP